tara:strand:- start:2331 stop:3851 length:1521 start_codon:yes stop_codon:yes gene_type:complete
MVKNYLESEKNLIVLEVANNHQGDMNHAKEIITTYAKVVKNYREHFDFAIKFQYRNLNSFIHKNYIDSDLRYVKRFLSTELKLEEFLELKSLSEKEGFISMCTPFDEISVQKVIDHNYGILKIASASLDDWPLIEEIGKQKDTEVIASIGGAPLEAVKRFYSFMKNKNINFGMNYCVSLYPTNLNQLNLSYLQILKSNFPDIRIGFSTHEGPDTSKTASYALHAGATIFEKHIALENEAKGYTQNDYSVYPDQLILWLDELTNAKIVFGSSENRNKIVELEKEALRPLQRGAFANTDLKEGSEIEVSNMYFAIPSNHDQLIANDISKFNKITLNAAVAKDEPIHYSQITISNKRTEVEKIRDKVNEDFTKYNITVPKNLDLEISHHYGIDSFYEFGTVMCTLVNKDYCKKILYQFPNQTNPEHFHKIKEETFILLEGDLTVKVNGIDKELKKGDILTINIGDKHSFSSKKGAIFEEISTEHISDDSYYTDNKIMENQNRKSKISLS